MLFFVGSRPLVGTTLRQYGNAGMAGGGLIGSGSFVEQLRGGDSTALVTGTIGTNHCK